LFELLDFVGTIIELVLVAQFMRAGRGERKFAAQFQKGSLRRWAHRETPVGASELKRVMRPSALCG